MNSDDIIIIIVIVVLVAVVKPLNAEDIRLRATSGRCGTCWTAVLWTSTGVDAGRRAAAATTKNDVVRQIQTGVMLDGQIVSVVAASRSVARGVSSTTTPHSSVNLRRLEERLVMRGLDVVAGGSRRQLDEEEKFVQNIQTTTTDVTTCVMTDVTKYRLNCVTIRIAFNNANKQTNSNNKNNINKLTQVLLSAIRMLDVHKQKESMLCTMR